MNARNNPPTVYDEDDTPILGTGRARRLAMGTWGEVIDAETGETVTEAELEKMEKQQPKEQP